MAEPACGQNAGPGVVHRLQPAAEREQQHEAGVGHGVDGGQARAREGVVGRALVRMQRDRVGEGLRHGVAMAAHVVGVAVQQAEAEHGAGEQEGQEHQGEGLQGERRELEEGGIGHCGAQAVDGSCGSRHARSPARVAIRRRP